MKYFISVILTVFILSAHAEEKYEIDEEAAEFSKVMGIDGLLSGVLDQTRDALKSSMNQLNTNFKHEFPNMTIEQEVRLKEIFDNYIDLSIGSIDVEKASYIYVSAIAEKMTRTEMDIATEFYQSEEGKNLMITVSEAASKMNAYLLDDITKSTQEALVILTEDIGKLRAELAPE